MNNKRAFVAIDGRQLEYHLIDGAPGRPMLVFLHEGLGSLALWKDYPDALAAAVDCPALIYSRRGYGWSERLSTPFRPDYMHREAREDLPKILGLFNVERPVLIGHSDGASIALIAAGEGTVIPRALILEAPHVFVEDKAIASIKSARTLFQTTDLATRLAPYHRDPKASFQAWNDIWLHPDFRNWDIQGVLSSVPCPVQIIQGADDEYGTEAQIEALSVRLPGPCETLVLAECRHSPHRDQRDKTLAAMAKFIDKL